MWLSPAASQILEAVPLTLGSFLWERGGGSSWVTGLAGLTRLAALTALASLTALGETDPALVAGLASRHLIFDPYDAFAQNPAGAAFDDQLSRADLDETAQAVDRAGESVVEGLGIQEGDVTRQSQRIGDADPAGDEAQR